MSTDRKLMVHGNPGLGRRSVLLLLVLCLAGIPLVPSTLRAQKVEVEEYKLKALWLFNFLQFTYWPDSSFSSPDAPVFVGILGDNPFGKSLAEVFLNEKLDKRKIVVRQFDKIDEALGAHLLFISKSERSKMDVILERTKKLPILTVSEVEGFCLRGGIINFVNRNQKLALEINLKEARLKQLDIKSQLLNLGKIVPEEE